MAGQPSGSGSESIQIVKLHAFGNWREVQSRTMPGQIYYYNRLTEISTWDKPQEWLDYEARQARLERERRDTTLLSEPEQQSDGNE
ncbi:WW domain-containing protein [Caenorhabditis elegans]|uniref:WW domain-containing protein n=1 Tax=Caenorhabditis elegans TaxID=6239 RepID=Q9XW29_CAEEL|nr:WW domain-containing protein [Caenorhabditis elegans]CAA22304.3 WW domain-containing protein [Caenorhabditis elegans]|eukprot:NP_001252140.1 Uncharacterized protein CELE_Y40B1A.1 [Caenorhabditis elegans]